MNDADLHYEAARGTRGAKAELRRRQRSKPFAVRFRDTPNSRRRLSLLRFATASEAIEYARQLTGASAVAVVKLEGRKILEVMKTIGNVPPSK